METSQLDPTTPKADVDAARRQAENLARVMVQRPNEIFLTGHLLSGEYGDLLNLLREDFVAGLAQINHAVYTMSRGEHVVREVSDTVVADDVECVIGMTHASTAPSINDVLTSTPTIMLLVMPEGFIPSRGTTLGKAALRGFRVEFGAEVDHYRAITGDMLDFVLGRILAATAKQLNGDVLAEMLTDRLANAGEPEFQAACAMVELDYNELRTEYFTIATD